VVRQRPLAKEALPRIGPYRNAVVGKVRELLRIGDGRHRVRGDAFAIRAKGESRHIGRLGPAFELVQQLEETCLAVATDHVVDVRCAHADFVVLCWEIPAPHHDQVRMPPFQLSGKGHRRAELWTWHDRHCQHPRAPVAHPPVERAERIRLDVAVDDHILVPALDERPKSQQRKREDTLSRCGALGVIQNDLHEAIPRSC